MKNTSASASLNCADRVVWVDWMRVLACFMVMVVHSTEPFYLGGNGSLVASASDARWAALFDSLVRSCVPLFLVASSYLQFPLRYTAAEFFKRRVVRILVPFAIWTLFYAFYWGEPVSNLKDLLLNFNSAAGHLWFVYMILGIYLIMPLLSPWAEKVGKKELGIYLAVWLFTTLIPFIRDWASSGPLAFAEGPGGMLRQAYFPLWGEAAWNAYGSFYYISGMVGYLLLGLWMRKFGNEISRGASFAIGIPAYLAGFAITFSSFLRRVAVTACGSAAAAGPASAGCASLSSGSFPAGDTIADAIWWETGWCYDSIGVALMTIGLVLMLRHIKASGKFYSRVVTPVSKASYGMYLCHMVALAAYSSCFRGIISCTPLVILATAAASYVTVAIFAILVQRIPKVGKFLMG